MPGIQLKIIKIDFLNLKYKVVLFWEWLAERSAKRTTFFGTSPLLPEQANADNFYQHLQYLDPTKCSGGDKAIQITNLTNNYS